MATKKVSKTDGREKLEAANAAVRRYVRLSNLLFGGLECSPYEMNELDPKSEFYELATELAKEMEIDWKTMSHQDSNRVMLAILEECFQDIRENEDERILVEIKVSKVEKKDDGKKCSENTDRQGDSKSV